MVLSSEYYSLQQHVWLSWLPLILVKCYRLVNTLFNNTMSGRLGWHYDWFNDSV